MNIYTVSFFGHRTLHYSRSMEEKLEEIIRNLICQKEYVDFLVGRDGDFDQIVSSTIRRLVKQIDSRNTSHILVLPYMRSEYSNNKENFLAYYDEVEICEESCQGHFKAAIQIRNKAMVDRSDLVVCCIQSKNGGAYRTIQYAEKQKKKIINIAD